MERKGRRARGSEAVASQVLPQDREWRREGGPLCVLEQEAAFQHEPREEPKSCWQPPWWAGGPLSGLWVDGPPAAGRLTGRVHSMRGTEGPARPGWRGQDLSALTPEPGWRLMRKRRSIVKQRKPFVFCAFSGWHVS